MIFKILSIAVSLIISVSSFAQQAKQPHLIRSLSGDSFFIRINLTERLSAPGTFATQTRRSLKCSYLVLSNLAKAAEAPYTRDAFKCINSHLASRDKKPVTFNDFLKDIERTACSAEVFLKESQQPVSQRFMAFSL
jgi:hypothetical protein